VKHKYVSNKFLTRVTTDVNALTKKWPHVYTESKRFVSNVKAYLTFELVVPEKDKITRGETVFIYRVLIICP